MGTWNWGFGVSRKVRKMERFVSSGLKASWGGQSWASCALGDVPMGSGAEGDAGRKGQGPSKVGGCHFPSDNLHIYFNPPLHE